MWEPGHLTNLWASTACYRDSYTFTFEREAADSSETFVTAQNLTSKLPLFSALLERRAFYFRPFLQQLLITASAHYPSIEPIQSSSMCPAVTNPYVPRSNVNRFTLLLFMVLLNFSKQITGEVF
jgi:hypothetical protein